MKIGIKSVLLAGIAVVSPALLAHEGNLSSAPWDACADKQQNNVCSFTNAHEDLFQGTCQSMSDSLYCVRNQPIVRSDAEIESGDSTEESHSHRHH